jgi:hypothetical protein
MLLSEFARYVRRLEETSSRTALVGIRAELFRATPPDEIAPTTYLLQGWLAPTFVPLDMGMGPTLVTDAIARAYHAERATIRERFDRLPRTASLSATSTDAAGAPPSGWARSWWLCTIPSRMSSRAPARSGRA